MGYGERFGKEQGSVPIYSQIHARDLLPAAAALGGLLGGQINYMFDTVITSVSHQLAGRLGGPGVTSMRRASALPQVPTLDELGNQLVGNSPEEFAQVIKNDLAKYARLVSSANIQIQ